MPITNVSAVSWVVCFGLNRTDSGLVGLYGLNHSDSAAHAKHYARDIKNRRIYKNDKRKLYTIVVIPPNKMNKNNDDIHKLSVIRYDI